MVIFTGEWESGYLRPLYRGLVLEQDGHRWGLEDWITEQIPGYDIYWGTHLGPVKITMSFEVPEPMSNDPEKP